MLAMGAGERDALAAAVSAGRLPNRSVLRMADRATHTVFTAIEGLRDLRGPKIGGIVKDATVHNSGGWQEWLAVLKRGGVVTFELVHAASHAELLAASLDQSAEVFQLEMLVCVQFTALVEMEFLAPAAGTERARVRLVVSGEVFCV